MILQVMLSSISIIFESVFRSYVLVFHKSSKFILKKIANDVLFAYNYIVNGKHMIVRCRNHSSRYGERHMKGGILMPRGVKGSGKAAASKAAAKVKKVRKAYPSREERVAMADKQIARLTKLNDSRKALVAKTEATLASRQSALAKSTEALEKTLAKKARLTSTPEKVKQERKTKKAQLDELASLLKASGKSIDEIIAALK